jgi:hypothetical protein
VGSVTATSPTALTIGDNANAAQCIVRVNLYREGVLIRCMTATFSKCEDTIHAVCLFGITKDNADIGIFRDPCIVNPSTEPLSLTKNMPQAPRGVNCQGAVIFDYTMRHVT